MNDTARAPDPQPDTPAPHSRKPASAANRPDTLTAPALRRALIAGARRVIAARDGLNKINVFPVADGDTGNNLAFTLGSVLNGALSRRSRHIADPLQQLANVPAAPAQRAVQHAAQGDRKSTRLNSSHSTLSRMPSSA